LAEKVQTASERSPNPAAVAATDLLEVGAEEADKAVSGAALRLGRVRVSALALGLAVGHLMSKPAYDGLKFTTWSKILAGQVNRGHYAFVFDARNEVVGMVGWAYCDQATAENWVRGKPVTALDNRSGKCVIFNLWSASDSHVNAMVLRAARKAMTGCETLYYRRLYPNGRVRPVRLSVNRFVNSHLSRI